MRKLFAIPFLAVVLWLFPAYAQGAAPAPAKEKKVEKKAEMKAEKAEKKAHKAEKKAPKAEKKAAPKAGKKAKAK